MNLDDITSKCTIYVQICLQINNAGVNFNLGSSNSVEYAQMVIATNYYGTKNMTQAMVPLMKPSSAGARIVNVSSRLAKLNGRRNVSAPSSCFCVNNRRKKKVSSVCFPVFHYREWKM